MRGAPLPVVAKAREYLAEHRVFTFSIITRYEILRGLKAKSAITQLQAFDRLCAGSQIVPLTDAAVVKASEINAEDLPSGWAQPWKDARIKASYPLNAPSRRMSHVLRDALP